MGQATPEGAVEGIFDRSEEPQPEPEYAPLREARIDNGKGTGEGEQRAERAPLHRRFRPAHRTQPSKRVYWSITTKTQCVRKVADARRVAKRDGGSVSHRNFLELAIGVKPDPFTVGFAHWR